MTGQARTMVSVAPSFMALEVLTVASDSLSGSFLFIPSENEPTPLEKENAALKSALESMKQQVETFKQQLEARKQHEIQLRDSVYLATKEVRTVFSAFLWVR